MCSPLDVSFSIQNEKPNRAPAKVSNVVTVLASVEGGNLKESSMDGEQ